MYHQSRWLIISMLTSTLFFSCKEKEGNKQTEKPTVENKSVSDEPKSEKMPEKKIEAIKTPEVNIPENNYDNLKTKFVKTDKDISQQEKWIRSLIDRNVTEGTSGVFTSKCNDYVNDVIEVAWGYDGSIDEATLKKRWSNKYDLKYADFANVFDGDGNGGWGSKKISNLEYLGEVNNGDWFKLTIKGGTLNNDYSETLIRVIKVINKNGKFFIDNFLSL